MTDRSAETDITTPNSQPSFIGLAVKTIVVHTVTYFACGFVAYVSLDYERHFAEPGVRDYMRPTDDPWVMAGPLFQPVRGLLFAIALYPLRDVLFGRKQGWLAMWGLLVIVGILSTFGPSPGSVEGMIYTVFPIRIQLFGLPEVLAQSLLLSVLLCYWVNHPGRRWPAWLLGTAFIVAMLLPVLGLLFGEPS